MNVSSVAHIDDEHILDEELESYSLGKLSAEESAPLEEHLLICPGCQARLAEVDEYIEVAKVAAASLDRAGNSRIRQVISEFRLPCSFSRPARGGFIHRSVPAAHDSDESNARIRTSK